MNSVINLIKTLLNQVFSLWVTVTFSDGQQFSRNGVEFLHHMVFVEGYTIVNNLNEIAGFSLMHESSGYPLVVVQNSKALRDYASRVVGYATGLGTPDVSREEAFILQCLVFAQASRYPNFDEARFKGATVKSLNLTEKISEESICFDNLWRYGYASPSNLADLGGNVAVELLSEYLLDDQRGIRLGAVQALGLMHGPAAFSALAKALDDKDVAIRREALDWILWISFIDSKEALEKARLDEDPEIRQRAEEELRKWARHFDVGFNLCKT